MAHWEYVVWAGSSPVGLVAIWRYAPRAFLMLVGGLTKDPQRSKQCAEMLRLQRKDASNIQSYLVDPPAQQPTASSSSLFDDLPSEPAYRQLARAIHPARKEPPPEGVALSALASLTHKAKSLRLVLFLDRHGKQSPGIRGERQHCARPVLGVPHHQDSWGACADLHAVAVASAVLRPPPAAPRRC